MHHVSILPIIVVLTFVFVPGGGGAGPSFVWILPFLIAARCRVKQRANKEKTVKQSRWAEQRNWYLRSVRPARGWAKVSKFSEAGANLTVANVFQSCRVAVPVAYIVAICSMNLKHSQHLNRSLRKFGRICPWMLGK